MIQVWQSYSCNNSSSYRLIARFVDDASAHQAAAALAELFAKLAGEDGDRRGERSVLRAIAKQYDIEWEDEGWYGPEEGPFAFAHDELVIVHHDYCLGLGPGVPKFLEERGGAVDQETWADLKVSLLFRSTPGLDPLLDDELTLFFMQMGDGARRPEDYKLEPMITPWTDQPGARGSAAMFRDAGTVGIALPIRPRDLARMKAWLAKRELDAVIRIDEPADEELFAALHTARCTACAGELEYLDPRLHDIETAQLICKPCGGLYELEAFTKGKS
jgi:hypothetical protein